MKKKLSLQTILAICACVVFLVSCKTVDNLSKSVTEFLKTPCEMEIEKAEAKYEARDYDSALQILASAENECKDYSNTREIYAERGVVLKNKIGEIYLTQAKDYHEKKQYVASLKEVNKALEILPENQEAIQLKSDASYGLAKAKMPKTIAKIDRLFKDFVKNNLPIQITSYDFSEGKNGNSITCQFQMGMFTFGQLFGCSDKRVTQYLSAYYDDLLSAMSGYPVKYVNGSFLFILMKTDPNFTPSQKKLVQSFQRMR